MRTHEAILTIISRLQWEKCHQIVINFIQEDCSEWQERNFESFQEVKDHLGSLSYRAGIILEVMNPKFKDDILMLETIIKMLNAKLYDWEYKHLDKKIDKK